MQSTAALLDIACYEVFYFVLCEQMSYLPSKIISISRAEFLFYVYFLFLKLSSILLNTQLALTEKLVVLTLDTTIHLAFTTLITTFSVITK